MSTKPLRCIIVDDEPPAIKILTKYIDLSPGLECIATTTKSIEALQLIEKEQPDILFLDIQMPHLTGIQLSKLIKDKTNIIFTTAYAQFAVEGFEVNAIDYLLKPIALNRFLEAVEKVKQPKNIEEAPKALTNSENYFFIKTDGKNKFQKVIIEDIMYIESIRNYIVVHTLTKQIVTYNTLKYIEENLPVDLFFKIHKSYIVAFDKIEKTDTNDVYINNRCLPLGDTYKQAFFRKINLKKL